MTGRELQETRRRELGLVGLRTLLIVYAFAQVWAALRDAHEPSYVTPLSITLAVGLTVGNVAIASGAIRAQRVDHLRAIGAAAYLLDAAVILGLLWTTTAYPSDPVWVIGFLLPLEGAARYGLVGALLGAAAFAGSEALREQYLPERFPPYAFDASALAYRVGMAFVVAIVAGGLARSLRRETKRANERADEAERLARREADARERLEELDVMKTDFIAITSHELRTPLSSIRGFVDTLRRRRDVLPDEQIDEFLAIVQLQGERLARLVEDLLTVSRLEAGVLTLSPQTTDIGPLLHDVVRGLGDDAKRIDWHAEPDIPPIVVDPQRLAQVLTNLLTNALKFSSASRRIVVRADRTPAGGATISVEDHGGGIAPDQIDRIFERFHQAQHVQRREAEGVGLGLYITKELVDRMEGEIRVTSVVGDGSTFKVTLPAAPSGAAAARSTAPSAVRSGLQMPSGSPAASPREQARAAPSRAAPRG
jgi:signal transduction histidine kinase